MAHIRRWDNLTGVFVHIIACVFWFHPLLWWMERRLNLERERACDEMVLASGASREAYVAGILKVCRFQLGHIVAGASGISGSDLKHRMELIMSCNLKTSNRALPRAIFAILASGITLVPFTLGLLQPSSARATQHGCYFSAVEYTPGTVLEMSRSTRKICVTGSWEKTDRSATALAKIAAPPIYTVKEAGSPLLCLAKGGESFSLGAIVNTPGGLMRCDKFVLAQYLTWRPLTPAELATKK